MPDVQNNEALLGENRQLRARLEELEETLRAIRAGEVDALVVSTPQGEQVYTLTGADQPYRVMVEEMSEGAVTLAQDGTILYCNGRFAELMKTPHEQIIGRSLCGWVAAHDSEKCDSMLARGWEGVVHDELALQAGDATQVPAYLSMCPLPESVGKGIATVITDLTQLKRAEDELRKYHIHLEHMVDQRTAQFEEVSVELEGLAYSVSHDLRVPLRAIDGFSQLLLKRYEGKLDDEGKRYLNVVRDNTRKLNLLFEAVLAFSRMGRQRMADAEIDMEALVRAAFEELKPAFAGRELTLEIKPLPPCHGDQVMLRQVWANLLANAIKFTRPKAAALVEVGGHTEGAEQVYYVKDNGAGFDMQYADKLFGLFQRLHGVEEFEGTGTGLAIVKRIVTRHGGRVWAEGKVDEGATFYFALPSEGRKT